MCKRGGATELLSASVEKLRMIVDIVGGCCVRARFELIVKAWVATCGRHEKLAEGEFHYRGCGRERYKACPEQPVRACLRLFRGGPERDAVAADRQIGEWFEPCGPRLVVCHG